MAVGGYTVALMQDKLADIAVARTVGGSSSRLAIGVVAAAMVAGLVVGVAAARLRGPYLAGVTLALAVIVPAIARHGRRSLNGDQGLPVRRLDAGAPDRTLGTTFTASSGGPGSRSRPPCP